MIQTKIINDNFSLFTPQTLHNDTIPSRTGKPGEMEQHFPVREKSGIFMLRLEKSGKSQGISPKILKKSEKIILGN